MNAATTLARTRKASMTVQTKAAPIVIRLWVLRDGDWAEQECGGVDARFSMRCKLEAEGFKTKLTEVKPKKPVMRVTKQVWFEQREGYGWLMRGTEIAYNVFPDAVYTAGGDSVTLASLPKKVQAVIKASAPQDWPLAHLLA